MANQDTLGQVNDKMREASRLELYKQDEMGFVGFVTGTVTANGGTQTLHLKNPSANSNSIDVVRFLVSPQFAGEFAIYDSFSSAPSGGSSVSIDNLKMDAGGGVDSGNMTMNSGVSFTADGTHLDIPTPGGGNGGNTVGELIEGTEPIIEPGREIVCELTNQSGDDELGGMAIVYLEREDV
jgi:hypothetical protein